MDAAYINTFSALAGTVVGGVTSFATTWLTTRAQARAALLRAEKQSREKLYGQFMDQLAGLYGAALKSESVDYARLTTAYALSGRIELKSSPEVTACAQKAIKFVVDIALAPVHSDAELRQLMDDPKSDIIGEFARACREELRKLR